ncbi:hypothetical protein LR97_14955 [Salmonella enterica]|nr:hypothetical protein [Salmonella enterica]EDC7978893.1 hypothetical protein [Salmonella enterica subsp. enterica serovar Give]EDQ5786250.1 hypothetical protein [Salmonella enterica subsp. enterica]EAQ6087190.1 hypothetical protein [Salmonella enterica]EAX1198248.1 hypothetical protein [Salmonella enterica]
MCQHSKDFVNIMIDMKNIVIHAKNSSVCFLPFLSPISNTCNTKKNKIILNQMVKCLFLATTYPPLMSGFPDTLILRHKH